MTKNCQKLDKKLKPKKIRMKIDPYLSPKMLIIVSVGKEQAENSKIWWGWVKEGEKMNKKKCIYSESLRCQNLNLLWWVGWFFLIFWHKIRCFISSIFSLVVSRTNKCGVSSSISLVGGYTIDKWSSALVGMCSSLDEWSDKDTRGHNFKL